MASSITTARLGPTGTTISVILIFDANREDMLEAALDVYLPTTGATISRDRIRLYNAASAICYLAFRRGISPEQISCGRTLAEDLQWVRTALSLIG
jgi:hypothetical protein